MTRGPIDFGSDGTTAIFNPRLPGAEAGRLASIARALPALRAHVWLATSGSAATPKLVALSKRAFLESAEAVNTHLESDARDVWLNVLPLFHVAGLGILARSHVSGARWVGEHDASGLPAKWSPRAFVDAAEAHRATLSALVPAQLGDLVREAFTPPAALRAIVVGSDALAPALYRRARESGWPILPSYGATETASQVASAPLASLDAETEPGLRVLGHAALRTNDAGVLEVRGASLFTAYGVRATDGSPGLVDPKRDGWWTTADRGRVVATPDEAADGAATTLVVEGREDDAIKIGGELVSMASLTRALETARLDAGLTGDAAVIALPDERLGHAILLAVDRAEEADAVLRSFGERVAPFARPKRVDVVPTIPRTPLGKLRRRALVQLIESLGSR